MVALAAAPGIAAASVCLAVGAALRLRSVSGGGRTDAPLRWLSLARPAVRGPALTDVLERLATELRSGASPRQAIATVAEGTTGPLGDDLGRIRRRVQLGLPLTDSVRAWPAQRPGHREIAAVAAALALAIESGGSAARAVDDVADAVRARAELAEEAEALASQARASASVMAVLPIGFVAVAGAVDPAMARTLVATGFGRVCLVTGLTLEFGAFVWMRQIIRSALS